MREILQNLCQGASLHVSLQTLQSIVKYSINCLYQSKPYEFMRYKDAFCMIINKDENINVDVNEFKQP